MSILQHPATVRRLRAQHGVIGRHQLLDVHSRGEVDSLVNRSTLVPVQRGVYRVRGAATTPEMEAMAAQIRARPDARLSGPFVLGQLDVEPFGRSAPFRVLTVPGRRLTGVDFTHATDPRPDRRLTPIGPLRTVHPTVAFIDAVVGLDDRAARVVLHVLRRAGRWSQAEWAAEAASRGPQDEGVARVRGLLAEGALEVDSAEEVELGRRLRAIDPSFEPQVWITERYRVDWFLRRVRLGFEYQGVIDHDHPGGRAADARKAAEADRVGVRIIPVVAGDLRTPGFARWVEGLIASREYELRRGR